MQVNCDSMDKKHPGKPRANGKRKPYGYGWFMAVDPRTLRILGVSCLHRPEGNEAQHSDQCHCNPHHVRRLARRSANVNTSAAEQAFSWFRQYARGLNEFSPHQHQLEVLVFCKLHNDVCRGLRPGYLSQFPYKRKKVSKAYSCSKKGLKTALL